jgi:alkylation response protein AidB-like acyl-CoA dehydrogenase
MAFPSGAFAAGAGPEVAKAKLGFIALTDASPLIIAKERGFFAKHGMPDVEVLKQASWAAVRDNLVLGSERGGIDGSHILNEIRFDDVRVPQFNRIGEENKGWTYAKFLLGNERASIAFIPQSTHLISRIKEIAGAERSGDGGLLADDPAFRARLASLEIELDALRITNERVLFDVKSGSAGNGGAILKSKGTFISQALSEVAMEAVQHYGLPWVMEALYPGWNLPPIGPDYAKTATPHYMRQRANTIEGGSEEVQKNVIAKQVLGL